MIPFMKTYRRWALQNKAGELSFSGEMVRVFGTRRDARWFRKFLPPGYRVVKVDITIKTTTKTIRPKP